MPNGVKIDKNGRDITNELLKDSNDSVSIEPIIKNVKTPYKSKDINLNFDPSEVSLYDIPLNKDFVKKIKLNGSLSRPVASTNIDQLLEFSKTRVDTYSNTSLPIVAPTIAISSFNVPHVAAPVSKVKCNNEPLNFESINRGSVEYYNNYRLVNLVPLESQENLSETSSINEKIMIRRLEEVKNTYRKSQSPLVVKYNNDNVKEMYEKRPKFENNKMSPFVGPKISSHMKNHDRVYEQSLKLL